MKVCWFSTGISSFVACYLAKDVDEIIYTHVPNQHPDSLRFLHDCEKVLGREITILQSDEWCKIRNQGMNSLTMATNFRRTDEIEQLLKTFAEKNIFQFPEDEEVE